MTGALVVKGFNEIRYDELMDVNGGVSTYAYTEIDLSGNWKAEAGFRTDGGFTAAVGVGSEGPYARVGYSYGTSN